MALRLRTKTKRTKRNWLFPINLPNLHPILLFPISLPNLILFPAHRSPVNLILFPILILILFLNLNPIPRRQVRKTAKKPAKTPVSILVRIQVNSLVRTQGKRVKTRAWARVSRTEVVIRAEKPWDNNSSNLSHLLLACPCGKNSKLRIRNGSQSNSTFTRVSRYLRN